MSPREITIQLKAFANQIGLAGLSVGPAAPLDIGRTRLKKRISKGYMGHYGFERGAEDNFCHPENHLPGAKSLIACALSYFEPDNPQPSLAEKPTGFVARFARGRDYHQVMIDKLKAVAAHLKKLSAEAQTHILCDTGPLMDRASAESAGLGWFGKNACFFVDGWGSWVVLGEIITNIDLPHDPPFEGHKCGNCDLCMKACPTGAIREPFEVDLNRCVSHLTQMSGIIPREMRPLMSSMVYGCDICQEVCPQNYSVKSGEVEPGPFLSMPDLIDLLDMTNSEFRADIGASAAGWIGRNRLRRNACVALGNMKSTEAIPSLKRALHDRSEVVRAHAAWALGEIATEKAITILAARQPHETDPEAAREIQEALAQHNVEDI